MYNYGAIQLYLYYVGSNWRCKKGELLVVYVQNFSSIEFQEYFETQVLVFKRLNLKLINIVRKIYRTPFPRHNPTINKYRSSLIS